MKEKTFLKCHKTFLVSGISIFCMMIHLPNVAMTSEIPKSKVISYVDYNLDMAQKYALRVDGKPFYMTNIQVRLDKLRYRWGWNAGAREAIIAQAADDGFNTVSVPIHWCEVEPGKDKFDWTTLDEYLGLANKYKLKVELLWFGSNSGGHVQWLSPDQLRVPGYVLLYTPGSRSSETTSDYTIRRDMSDYTLDLNDNNLKARESYILGQVMSHISSWDAANGSKHTVIGVQLGNEVRGINGVSFPASLVVSYMSDLGSAVKNSPYVVWTRLNCVCGDHTSRIYANEALRSGTGTNIDFIGIDLYTSNSSTIPAILPYKGENYRMIMECGSEVYKAAQLQLAALAGNNAYDHYDMIGPDGHGLYDRNGIAGFTPHGPYIDDVRLVNKILKSDIADIALNANGYGLFVHNWTGDSPAPSTGVDGINFMPGYPTSQGISIHRSNTEIILMTTRGGHLLILIL